MPRMRTIDQAAAELKAADPDCAFTRTALRRLVVTGALPSVRVGQKYLVDLDRLETFLTTGIPCSSPAEVVGIRRIAVGGR